MNVSLTQSQIQVALRNFLLGILPLGIKVIAGQANRVPEPRDVDYVVFWPINRTRLAFNIDATADAVFTGSITGTLLDITDVNPAFTGRLGVGSKIFGVGLADNTTITALGTGTGGVGTYTVSPPQAVASETIAAGTKSLMQKTEIVYQCDVHGPNSADNAHVISTVAWDSIAGLYFQSNTSGVYPLYSEDPRQMPFINGEDQFENRWVVDIHLQANILTIFPQEFSDAIFVDVISVDAEYPSS